MTRHRLPLIFSLALASLMCGAIAHANPNGVAAAPLQIRPRTFHPRLP